MIKNVDTPEYIICECTAGINTCMMKGEVLCELPIIYLYTRF